MVLPDVFIDQDSPTAMYAKAGLDAKGIVAKVFEALGRDVRRDVGATRRQGFHLTALDLYMPLSNKRGPADRRLDRTL